MSFDHIILPPLINSEVTKIDLGAYSVKVSSGPPEPDKWEVAKQNLSDLLEDLRVDLDRLKRENIQLQMDCENMAKQLADKNNIGRTFDIIWCEVFGPEVGPFVKDHFKKRLGI